MSNIAPTYDEFIEEFPAFALLDDTKVESALSFSSRFLSDSAWGSFYSDAVGLDAAHNLAVLDTAKKNPSAAFQGAAGPVSSVSAAGVSTSFNSAAVTPGSKSDSWYSKTVYGQLFLRLRDNVIAPGSMAA